MYIDRGLHWGDSAPLKRFPLQARRLAGILHQKVVNQVSERRFGIETRGVTHVNANGAENYSATPYLLLNRLFERIGPRRTDVFVDVGCGKGRAVCIASRWPMQRVIGIEIDGDLLAAARRNVNRVAGETPVEFYHMRAENYVYADATIVFLYNPFEPWVLQSFLGRLKETHRRPLRVIYVNSVHSNLLEDSDWLVKVDIWHPGALPGWLYPVSFYQTAP